METDKLLGRVGIVLPLYGKRDYQYRNSVMLQLDISRGEDLLGITRTTSNTGLVYRRVSKDSLHVYGINSFFDKDLTYGHQRLGFGVDYQDYVQKITANYYYPITDEINRNDGFSECSMEGYDVSFKGKDLLRKHNIYGIDSTITGYHWKKCFKTDNDVRGYRAELSYKPVSILELYASYQNDDQIDSTTTFGLRSRYYFGEKIKPAYSSKTAMQKRFYNSLAQMRFDRVDREGVIRVQQRKVVVSAKFISPVITNGSCRVYYGDTQITKAGVEIPFGSTIKTELANANCASAVIELVYPEGASFNVSPATSGNEFEVVVGSRESFEIKKGLVGFVSNGNDVNIIVSGGSYMPLGTTIDFEYDGNNNIIIAVLEGAMVSAQRVYSAGDIINISGSSEKKLGETQGEESKINEAIDTFLHLHGKHDPHVKKPLLESMRKISSHLGLEFQGVGALRSGLPSSYPISITEGQSKVFKVRMQYQPVHDVAYSFINSKPNELVAKFIENGQKKDSVTVNKQSYNNWVDVEITAPEDTLAHSSSNYSANLKIVATDIASKGGKYNSVIAVDIADNDVMSLQVSGSGYNAATTTATLLENGGAVNLNVSFPKAPTSASTLRINNPCPSVLTATFQDTGASTTTITGADTKVLTLTALSDSTVGSHSCNGQTLSLLLDGYSSLTKNISLDIKDTRIYFVNNVGAEITSLDITEGTAPTGIKLRLNRNEIVSNIAVSSINPTIDDNSGSSVLSANIATTSLSANDAPTGTEVSFVTTLDGKSYNRRTVLKASAVVGGVTFYADLTLNIIDTDTLSISLENTDLNNFSNTGSSYSASYDEPSNTITRKFRIKANKQPDSSNPITVALSDNSGSDSISARFFNGDQITSTNWQQGIEVEVTFNNNATNGNDVEIYTFTASGGGSNWSQKTVTLTTTMNDNDLRLVILNSLGQEVANPSIPLSEGAGSSNTGFKLALNITPQQDITINSISIAQSSGGGQITEQIADSISKANATTGIPIMLTAQNDNYVGNYGDTTMTINATVDGVSMVKTATIQVVNTETQSLVLENIDLGITGSGSSWSVSTQESNTSGTFRVRLSKKPISDVAISFTDPDSTGTLISGSIASNTITPNNWNVGQIVTITFQHNSSHYANATETFSISGSGGGTWSQSSASVAVTSMNVDVVWGTATNIGYVYFGCRADLQTYINSGTCVYSNYISKYYNNFDGTKSALLNIGVGGRFRVSNAYTSSHNGIYTITSLSEPTANTLVIGVDRSVTFDSGSSFTIEKDITP